MKNLIRSTILSLPLIVASLVHAGIPALNVTVSDAAGKAAFKGTTNANGAFATPNLKPGNYVVQLNSKSGAVTGNYTIVVSAGKKKVSAGAVAGQKFAGGGVALKVDVAAGLNITGQVAVDGAGPMKNGKKMVWIPPQAGSHMPGHWVEEGSPEAVAARSAGNLSTGDVQKMQDRGRSPGG